MSKPVLTSKSAINSFNLQMRNQPWYQDWFRRQGLNPDQVSLSKAQRASLEQEVLAHGAPTNLFNDLMIDPAGNVNSEHGFASQPTWLKALEVAAPVAGAAIFAPGSLGALANVGGGAGAPAATTAAGAGAGAGAGAFSLGNLAMGLAGPVIGAATNIYGARASAAAGRDASAAQIAAANTSAAAQAKATADALKFQEDQLAEQKRQFDATQAQNYGLYQDETAYNRGVQARSEALTRDQIAYQREQEAQRRARLLPYSNAGLGALAQVGQPMPRTGTLGTLMRAA